MKVGVYAMGSRGLAVLHYLLVRHPATIGYLVTEEDSGVQPDLATTLLAVAHGVGIPAFTRRGIPAELPQVDQRWAVAWRWLLPLEGPTLVVFHDSLLPRYRGHAPLVSALINGDTRLGVTALRAAALADTGAILAQAATDVTYPLTIEQALAAVAPCYEKLAKELCNAGAVPPVGVPQNDAAATYSLWRDEADYTIDWSMDAPRLRRFVDATGAPYRGAATRAGDRPLRLRAVSELADVMIENRTPGKILALDQGRPVVVCGRGLLRIDAMDDESTGVSALPWPRLRTRFK